MKKKNITHSKIKNSGVLFELLVRQITVDTLANAPNSRAVSLMKEYFKPNTELGKELQLYRSFFEMGRLTETRAAQFIDLICNQRKKLSERKLLEEKYNLIKELKKEYNLDTFLRVKIPNYKIYASIYKTFLTETSNFDVSNIQEVATSRFTLIEHLIRDAKAIPNIASEAGIIETFKNESEDVRLLSYKLALDKFNEKYQNLTLKQKTLLREYINCVSNSDNFINFVHSEIIPLKEELTSLAKSENKVLQIKLKEVINCLDQISSKKRIRDNDLKALMIAYQISEELKIK